MPFVPAPNTVQVNVVYSWQGQEVENVLYYTLPTLPTFEDMQLLGENINSYLRSTLIPILTTVTQLIRVVVTLLDAADSLIYISTTSLPQAGGDANESMPNNVAFCISAYTSRRGRSFRGRNYIPGLGTDLVTGNNVNGSTAAGLVDIWEGLGAVGADDGWVRTIVSRISGGVARTTAEVTPVTSVVANDTVVDSQRRRLPGRGA